MLFSELLEVLDPEPHAAPLNMAIDEVLLRQAEQPALRIYRWRERALSFGYFGKISEAESAAAGRVTVRRWTGGGMVEHGKDLTYTLVVPRGHLFLRYPAAESYRLIHEMIMRLMAEEGALAEVVPITNPPISSACFSNPVQYDLAVAGMKVAGAAQRRTRWGLLHQGSLQLPQLRQIDAGKMASFFSSQVSQRDLTPEIRQAALTLVETKYGTTEWLRKF